VARHPLGSARLKRASAARVQPTQAGVEAHLEVIVRTDRRGRAEGSRRARGGFFVKIDLVALPSRRGSRTRGRDSRGELQRVVEAIPLEQLIAAFGRFSLRHAEAPETSDALPSAPKPAETSR